MSDRPTSRDTSDNEQSVDSSARASSFLSSWGWLQTSVTPSLPSLINIVDTVKKQTEVVANVYKRDLSEFVDVVSTQSKERIGEWSQNISNLAASRDQPSRNQADVAHGRPESPSKRKPSDSGEEDTPEDLFSMFTASIGSLLSSAVQITPAQDKTKRITTIFDRKSARIAEIRESPQTYLLDPEPASAAAARYKPFKKGFVVSHYAPEIAKVLADDSIVAQLMGRIVPSQASYVEFWARYFFRVREVEYEEEQRKKIITENSSAEEEITWDSDDEDDAKEHVPLHQPLESAADSNSTVTKASSEVNETETVDKQALATTASSPVPPVTLVDTPSNSTPPSPLKQVQPQSSLLSPPIIESLKGSNRGSPTSSQTEDWTNVDVEPLASASDMKLDREEATATSHQEKGEDSRVENKEKGKSPLRDTIVEPVKPMPSSKEEEDWADWE
ncbi:hypothetical protein SeLEV6574_g00193 [Synchytrium endobioticum]|uniref:BSD domain-containing protein n=1 Tax=Synchytrium endobioticum TaxID=286115 RepID=A0A507DJL1_9FUNG|nr:hypothetical protein SeLEV6574_g00193 [Synchytrium endobioticum]